MGPCPRRRPACWVWLCYKLCFRNAFCAESCASNSSKFKCSKGFLSCDDKELAVIGGSRLMGGGYGSWNSNLDYYSLLNCVSSYPCTACCFVQSGGLCPQWCKKEIASWLTSCCQIPRAVLRGNLDTSSCTCAWLKSLLRGECSQGFHPAFFTLPPSRAVSCLSELIWF